MNELIVIESKNGVNFVGSLKSLYLDVGMDKSNWASWLTRNVKNNMFFSEGQDYQLFVVTTNGRNGEDCSCTLDMAKHLILQMPTENAHKYRQYLIDFESVGKFTLPQTYKEALIELVVQVEKNEILELENKKQQEVIEMQKPKADYFDCLVETNLLTGFRDCSKELGIKQNEFMKFLEDKKFIYRDKRDKPKPYAQHVDNGLFELRDFTSGSYSDVRTFITVKGKETFRLLLQVR